VSDKLLTEERKKERKKNNNNNELPLQSNSGHHPTPWLSIPKTMTIINSQEQDLLGNQILSKSEDFCILVAILDSKWPP
jgi:hypothetical protein